MTYQGFDLNSIPKRVTSRVDLDEAKQLLATIQSNGAASDMAKYETAEKARNAGLRAARLVDHVAPAGQRATIKTFGVDGKGNPTNVDPKAFAFVVSLKAAKAAKAEAAGE